nr:transcription factor MYB44-like [Tanacetum cinerariifolium]
MPGAVPSPMAEMMMMDIEAAAVGGGIQGPGYSTETFVDHPNHRRLSKLHKAKAAEMRAELADIKASLSAENNSQKKDMDQIEGPWSLEEDKMLQNLFDKHGPNWSLIGMSVPGRSGQSCRSRWFSLKFVRLEDEITWYLHEDTTIIQGAQNGILSHEVGGVRGHQAPSISDMARDNMSSEYTHSYSRDRPAPSWNALHKRDSSPMMIDSDYMQEAEGDKFGLNDFSEVSSKA